jgi:hypothetical protein
MSKLGLVWIVVLVAYSVARALAVGKTLGAYGVDPLVFLCFDAGSAIPLAIGQVKLIEGLKLRQPAMVQRWLVILTLSFIAPYAYLVLGANRPLPAVAYWVIGLLVVGVGASTFWRIRSEARRAVAASEQDVPGLEHRPSPTDSGPSPL